MGSQVWRLVPSVLAVDPGRTTGFVIWRDDARVEKELEASRFLEYVAPLIERGEIDFVVCERFIITTQTAKFSQAPWSLEQIGVLRFLCKRHDVSFVLQNVSDAKRFGTDDRLNAIGWKRPKGGGHARDAQRHLLLFLVKHDMIDDYLLVKNSQK